MKSFFKLLKHNWIYLLWFCIYLFIGWLVIDAFTENSFQSFFIALTIYILSIMLALSPAGETILRVLQKANPVATQKDREYLLPLFQEVYEQSRQSTPELRKDIRLYIIESMVINAFAAGKRTIAVTRGAVEALDREQLKGILAHEFGHMAHNDTRALIINLVGNGFFSLILFALRICMNIIQLILTIIQGKNVVFFVFSIIAWIIRILVELFTFVFIILGNILLSINSRINEYNADRYAFEIGYGEQLIASLYLLKQVSLPPNMTLMERVTASHPNIDNRIKRLEQMIG